MAELSYSSQSSHSWSFRFPLLVTPAAGGFDFDFAQKGSGLFGQDRVDVKAAPPFESGNSRQAGYDFQVPVVMRQFLGVERRRMDDEVIGRVVQRQFELAENRLQDHSHFFDSLSGNVLVMAGMLF